MKKAVLLFFGIIAGSSLVYSQCLDGDCVNGYGIYEYSDGDVYEGSFINSQRSGWGCYLYYTGGVNCGNWLYGQKELLNHFFYNSGSFAIGLWTDNNRSDTYFLAKSSGGTSFGMDPDYKSIDPENIEEKCPGNCEEGSTGLQVSASNGFLLITNGINRGENDFPRYRTIGGWQCTYQEGYYTRCGHYNGISQKWELVSGFFPGRIATLGLVSDIQNGGELEDHSFQWGRYINGKIRGNVNKTTLDYSSIYEMGRGCVDGECNDGIGTEVYSNGFYQGRFMNGKKQGWGCYVYKESGTVACGNWKEGDRHLLGYTFWNASKADGGADVFIGMYKDDKRMPWGIYVYEDGSIDYRTTPTRF